VSELSSEARKLFELAREGFGPDERRLAKVHAALKAQLGLGAAAAATVATKSAMAGTAVPGTLSVAAIKITGAVVLAGTIGLAGHAISTRVTPSGPPPALTGGAVFDRARSVAESVAATESAIVPAESLPPATGEQAPAAPANRAKAPAPSKALDPSVRRAEPAIVLEEEVPDNAGARSPARESSRIARPKPKAPGGADALAREVQILRDARAQLKEGDPEKALNTLDRHAQLHPQGTLAEEQLAARALALCSLGRSAEARTAMAKLERIAPRSPHLLRVKSSCGKQRD
jgi:hypothetical protein